MSDEALPIEITAKSVERAVNPADGKHSVRVRLGHTTPEGIEHEWNIWVPNEESFDRAVDLARKELNRVAAQIAAQATASGAHDLEEAEPDRSPSRERNRKWEEAQAKQQSGWTA